jgi:ParB-like chromosome segregation protein Spo0J
MSETIERSTLDLRYQHHRLRDKAREARLLSSLAQRGIEQPLEGVDTPQRRILLNGFKRYRCAEKLNIESVPYVSLGDDEALASVTVFCASCSPSAGR